MKEGSPIRILHLIDSAGVAGGQRYLLDLLRHSDPSFEHHVVLSQAGPLEGMLRDQHCGYVLIPMAGKFSFSALRKIRQYLHDEKIQIVHSHGYRSNLQGRLACALTRARNIATVHVSLYDYIDTPLLTRRFYLLIEKMTSFLVSKYICISTAMKDDFRKMGIRREKLLVIHNGVDLAVFHPRTANEALSRSLGIQGNCPVIGTVGRMVTEKKQIDLMEALSLLQERWPTLQCLFIGTGPLLGRLEHQAEQLGVAGKCLFPGVRTDIAEFYPLLDVFILPSRREPFGLVLLEAMASKVPVIATAAGGPLDIIQSGSNGLLVPPSNPRELAAGIDFLLSNPDRAKVVAQQGYETVRKDYRIQDTIRKVCDVYRFTSMMITGLNYQ